MDKSWMTVEEVAALKAVSKAAVYAAVKDGRLPSARILGRIAVKRRHAEGWLPISYNGRPGAKPSGRKPTGLPLSDEQKAKIGEGRRLAWAAQKARDAAKGIER